MAARSVFLLFPDGSLPSRRWRAVYGGRVDLIAAIGIFIDGWNNRCQPFVWTKTADQIIPSATRSKDTSKAGHKVGEKANGTDADR